MLLMIVPAILGGSFTSSLKGRKAPHVRTFPKDFGPSEGKFELPAVRFDIQSAARVWYRPGSGNQLPHTLIRNKGQLVHGNAAH
jgi:hypothetical protein